MSVDLKTPPALSQETEEELRVEMERREGEAELAEEQREAARRVTTDPMRAEIQAAAKKSGLVCTFGCTAVDNKFYGTVSVHFEPVESLEDFKHSLRELLENLCDRS